MSDVCVRCGAQAQHEMRVKVESCLLLLPVWLLPPVVRVVSSTVWSGLLVQWVCDV